MLVVVKKGIGLVIKTINPAITMSYLLDVLVQQGRGLHCSRRAHVSRTQAINPGAKLPDSQDEVQRSTTTHGMWKTSKLQAKLNQNTRTITGGI